MTDTVRPVAHGVPGDRAPADGFPDGFPVGGPAARRRANRNNGPTTMPSTNRTRVDRCLVLLRQGLAPFIARELRRTVDARRVDADAPHTIAANSRQADAPPTGVGAAAPLPTRRTSRPSRGQWGHRSPTSTRPDFPARRTH